ncbi:3-carboxyethylcatechol 2,3-dioxygenase [Sphingomonas sp. MMS24-J13]|uniref:3-carboxyethylcatechol 2,3-dioxygenase n=1 Tax=Sphingomonas sp. MMS24-J13 TaxID=3238686 RepID=UPI00384C209A
MLAFAACLSHTPLQGMFDPSAEVLDEIEAAKAELRANIVAFEPEIVFLFAPDHFNGFFYDLMPQFCIGTAADALGDFDTLAGKLNVAPEAAQCAASVLAQEIDVAVSHQMKVDHGFTEPLRDIFGSLDTPPIVPIFINSVAPPFASCRRARVMGEAVGRFARGLGKRALMIGSGGLSHEPPVPQIEGAPPEVARRLIDGRNPNDEAVAGRRLRLMDAARNLTLAEPPSKPLNPQWDHAFIAMAATGHADAFDILKDDEITQEAGASAHEVRTWIAALSAVGADAGYDFRSIYYRAIPEWIAGFGVASAKRTEIAA